MKLLFIGGNFFKLMEHDIIKNSKAVIQYAANKFEWNLIEGLSLQKNIELKILSAISIGSYPRDYKKLLINRKEFCYKNMIDCIYLNFINLWGFRNISRKNNLKEQIKKEILYEKNKISIIIYSPHTPFLQAAVYAKRINSNVKICLIVPDLPQYMNLKEKQSLIYRLLKKIDIKIFNKNLKYVDSFVLLTKEMKKILKVGDRKCIVVEGVVSSQNIKEMKFLKKNDKKRTILYTGTLKKKFGIDLLVEAFIKLKDESLNLVICGKGDYEDNIKNIAEKDRRIKYLGQIRNEEAIKLQQSATILVNPRSGEEEFTKYSFPSKNMEYLLSGRPLIAYKLQGIPDEYDDYILYVKGNSVESLKKKIEEVLKLSEKERSEIGEKARSFVLRNKNNKIVAERIIEMLRSV